jgi:hypothetical protein
MRKERVLLYHFKESYSASLAKQVAVGSKGAPLLYDKRYRWSGRPKPNDPGISNPVVAENQVGRVWNL